MRAEMFSTKTAVHMLKWWATALEHTSGDIGNDTNLFPDARIQGTFTQKGVPFPGAALLSKLKGGSQGSDSLQIE